jgi:ABC-2 type transport system ATP-binding protein
MQQGEQPLLQCIHVSKQKGEFILSDIDFLLEPGYVLGVIGRNGTGKSTLLRTLLGSYRLEKMEPEKQLNFQSKEGNKTEEKEIAEGNILLHGISVNQDLVGYKEQIAYVLNETPFPLGINAKDCGILYGNYYRNFEKEKYTSLLKDFEVPQKVPIKNLSKGQQIKQQLAFALSYEAKLYIMDEPTGNLDVEFREKFYGYIRSFMEDGTKGVIYASHLVDELEKIADYILWIGTKVENDSKKKGIQKYFGSLEDLTKQYQLVEAAREEAAVLSEEDIVGIRVRDNHQEMLVRIERKDLPDSLKSVSRYATLKEIMYYIEKGKAHETGFIEYLDGE